MPNICNLLSIDTCLLITLDPSDGYSSEKHMWFCLFLFACFIGMCALPQPVAGQWVASDDDDDWIHDKGGICFTDTLATSCQEVPNLCENSTNVDGMPMCGGVDINGNVYGFTESHFDS